MPLHVLHETSQLHFTLKSKLNVYNTWKKRKENIFKDKTFESWERIRALVPLCRLSNNREYSSTHPSRHTHSGWSEWDGAMIHRSRADIVTFWERRVKTYQNDANGRYSWSIKQLCIYKNIHPNKSGLEEKPPPPPHHHFLKLLKPTCSIK